MEPCCRALSLPQRGRERLRDQSRMAAFRGREQEQRGQPFRERDFGALENGLYRDGELLAALVALVDARKGALSPPAWSRHPR
jgi:hypothetical protein